MQEINTIDINRDTQIEELKRGNEFVYRRLYEMHYNELCSYIYSMSNNKQQSEDIVQNVMLKIWKNKENLKINSSIRNYLYKSCYNELIDSYKKNKKELNYIELTRKNALDFIVEEDTDIINSRLIRVKSEIEKLPKKCKEAFILNKLRGLKYKEVAEYLDISVKTVEIHISKAMSRIREAIFEDKA
ncbi:RNA polymerase sigma-70 factor [Aquimarina sp. 2201CG1-2-11]|uniref:RNA polymerase sigma factor n=1 Tax=Aquimarina discodermiae TaxID=3231043 RepID=UPI003461C433